jgi:hypothetical protein
MTPRRLAFFDCLYGVTAGTCSDLTPVPIHTYGRWTIQGPSLGYAAPLSKPYSAL